MPKTLLAAVAAAFILMIPAQAHAFGCGDSCAGPAISTSTTSVSVNEGSTATVSGSWSNGDVGGVAISASVGSVDVSSGTHNGTWTWTWTPQNGPQSTSLTLSVEGGDSIVIPITVANVVPSATGLSAPSSATTTTPFTISLVGATDPSPVDASGLSYAFDCGTGVFSTFGAFPSTQCSGGSEGFRTVRGEVRDPDGYISAAYTQLVGVFNPVTVTEGSTPTKSLASVGPVCIAGSVVNSYTWNGTAADGPGGSTPVNLDVELPFSGSCAAPFLDTHRNVHFDLVVNNAPPTATFHAPTVVAAGAAVPMSLTSPTDPSSADRAAGYTYSYACGAGAFGSRSSSSTGSCPGAASGSVDVKARIYDKDDGYTEYTASVPVDGSPPSTSIGTKPTGLDTDPTPSFTWTGTDPGGSVASYAYKVDDGGWSAFDSATGVTLPTLGDGPHTFQVKAKDAAGNEDATPDSYTWTIDTAAPDTAFAAKPSVTGAGPTLGWTSTESGSSFSYNLDNGGWSDWSTDANHVFSSLADGAHTLQVKSKDTAGNVDPSPDSLSWSVDSTPPDAFFTATPNTTGGASASFAWSATGASDYAYRLDGGGWSAWSSDSTHTFSGLAGGSHTMQVKARDGVGNEDPTPASFTWSVETPVTTAADTQTGAQTPAQETQTQTQTQTQTATPAATAGAGCKVPNLKKKKLADAKKALSRAHCKLGSVKKKKVKGAKHGRVASQSARAGAKLASGAKVNVVLAR